MQLGFEHEIQQVLNKTDCLPPRRSALQSTFLDWVKVVNLEGVFGS